MGRAIQQALDLLGVDADSDPATIAHAYRRLARTNHPDVSAEPDAAQRFATIAAAYELVRSHAATQAVDDTRPHPLRDSGAGDRPHRRADFMVDLTAESPSPFLMPRTPRRWATGTASGSPIVAGPVTVTPPRPPTPDPGGD